MHETLVSYLLRLYSSRDLRSMVKLQSEASPSSNELLSSNDKTPQINKR